MSPVLITAFVLGLTSNLHCLGMCGPIALSIPINQSSLLLRLGGILQYNLGRISVYGLLGLLTGFIGLSISALGALQWASIGIGVFMILYAWRSRLGKWIPHFSGIYFIPGNAMSFVVKKTGRWKLILLGALNGILPCGMVYIGLVNALLSPTPFSGMVAMIAFGAGTLPVMIIIVFMTNAISNQLRKRFSATIPYVLTLLGAMIILRGANLGIPYLSPSVSQQPSKHIQSKSIGVKMNCCSKPYALIDQNKQKN